MQIQTIRSFLMLCKVPNITKCSEILHISQQGLSRQIRSMEKELGTTLFERQPRGVRLTPQGELLHPYYQKIYALYEDSLHSLAQYAQNRTRDLTLYICPGIHTVLGTEFFLKFDQSHPHINLQLNFESDPECEAALTDGRADAAFLDWPEHPELFDLYQVIYSRLTAVMRPDHPLALRDSISFQDLRGQKCFFPDASHYMNQRFKKAYPEIYYSLDRSFISNEYENYINLPKVLGGIALSFEVTLRKLEPGLVVVPIREDSYISISYCVRKDRPADPAIRAFSDYVYENVDIITK